MIRVKYFILDDDNNTVEVSSTDSCAWRVENEDKKRVGFNSVNGADVSTVFLGMDHGWNGELELFETIIFGGERDQEQHRYATWAEAKAGHDRIVAELEAKQ